MRRKLFSRLLLCSVRSCTAVLLIASLIHAEELETEAAKPDLQASASTIDVRATKVIVQFTGNELRPASLKLSKADSSVFFVNNSDSASVDLAINFNGKSIHCHTKNLKLDDSGFLRSIKPIKPFDLAVLCFPTIGSYSFQITEVDGAKRTFTGEVQIHE